MSAKSPAYLTTTTGQEDALFMVMLDHYLTARCERAQAAEHIQINLKERAALAGNLRDGRADLAHKRLKAIPCEK